MKHSLAALVAFLAACGDDAAVPPDATVGVDAGADGGPPADAPRECPTGARDYGLVPFDATGDSPPFPDGFLFGAATAPHQVEGGDVNSDFWAWEQMGRAMGESSDDGPNHWEHYAEDFDRMQADGMNAYRMGIEWAKIFPTRESFDALTPDAAAVQHYHDVFAALAARGIAPMVTLHHFVSPIWWVDPGAPREEREMMGFTSPTAVDDFRRWASWAATEFGGEVDLWITINEPLVIVLAGYLQGSFPPGLTYDPSSDLIVRAVFGEVRCHAAAYDALHELDTVDADGDGAPALVSVAKHQRIVLPFDPCSTSDVAAAEQIEYLSNRLFLNAIVLGDVDANGDGDLDDVEDTHADPSLVGRADFLGINYYSLSLVNSRIPLSDLIPGIPLLEDGVTGSPVNDLGWAIYPEGFRIVLDEAATYGLPIYVTENGIADQGDVMRSTFLVQHLDVLARAIADGIDVRGYFHWSLMDNFEWVEGYCPRFGLYRVDYDDPDRPRAETDGARVYRRIIADGRVAADLHTTYAAYGDPTSCN